MKTSKSLSRPFAKAITCLILLVTTSLSLTSCKKEELANPQSAIVNDRTKNPAVKPSLLSNPQTATVNDKTKKPTEKPLLSGKPQTTIENERTKNPAVKPSLLSNPQTSLVSERLINPALLKFIFASIKIDHYAAATSLPDYSITVYSNGIATYEGRKNVNIKGSRQFEVSLAALIRINNLSIQFASISQPMSATASQVDAQPMVVTTYRAQIKGLI